MVEKSDDNLANFLVHHLHHKNFHYKDEWETLPKWKKVLFLYSKTQYEIIKHQHLIHHKFPAWNFSVSPYSNNIESLLGTAKNYAFT